MLKGKGLNTAVGDEGGFAPNLATNEEAIQVIIEAIEKAGYKPGDDVKIALDVAASEFYDAEKDIYNLTGEGVSRTAEEMVAYYEMLCSKYPVISKTVWQKTTGKAGHISLKSSETRSSSLETTFS